MIRIKDYIINENVIRSIHEFECKIHITFVNDDDIWVKATFEDIEWNYDKEVVRKALDNDIDLRIKIQELEEKNKTFEDYNKYLNNQLDKLEENKKLKEENQAVRNIIKKNSIPIKENYNDYYEDTPKEDKKIEKIGLSELYGIEFNEAKYSICGKINEIIDSINRKK